MFVCFLFFTFGLEKRALSTSGKEKRRALMDGVGGAQGRGFTQHWEGRQAHERPIRTSSHFGGELGTQSEVSWVIWRLESKP